MTLAQVAAGAVRRLEAAGISTDDARLDAAVLARHVLDWDSAQWLADRVSAPPAGFDDAYARAIDRRVRREPVAYITGSREFWGRTFAVTPAVLVPRPETELVVTEALAALSNDRERPTIIDVGTGSGCLAVTLACERADARIAATDISEDALDVAAANARRLGAPHVTFHRTHLLDGLTAPVSLVVSNPPYVPESDLATLSPEVRDFEPHGALFAGPDGLDVVRELVPAAARVLEPGGWLVFEIGAGQARAVRDIVDRTPGLAWRRSSPDLQGIPRVVVAQRA